MNISQSYFDSSVNVNVSITVNLNNSTSAEGISMCVLFVLLH
jgi:hypothetical protein